MSNIEKKFEKIFGFHPQKDIEPPLTHLQIVSALKNNDNQFVPIQPTEKTDPKQFQLIDGEYIYTFFSELDGLISPQPFTLIRRESFNGTLDVAYIFGKTFEPHDYNTAILLIHSNDWEKVQ